VRASDGRYYPGLDHLRAIAAFLVFGWHFTHGSAGFPAPFGPSATSFLGPFNEGHCGVALFMCLSGYLFAKILEGKQVVWHSFYWNRFLRLAPLLIAAFALRGAQIAYHYPEQLAGYTRGIVLGLFKPSWELGAWSIAVEIHFYCLLWIIIPLKRRCPPSLLCFLTLGLGTRLLIYAADGDVAYFAYWTLVGRLDQFILGIVAWEYRSLLKARHVPMAIAIVLFFAFYQWFVSIGGFYSTQGNRAVWIVLPTIEALFFSFLVVYYDTTFVFSRAWYWRLLEIAGAASYSIYLLHNFVVFGLARIAAKHLPGMAIWEVAEVVALVVFAGIVPVAWASYRYFEMPFLRLRSRYTRENVRDVPVAEPLLSLGRQTLTDKQAVSTTLENHD
jgi:peptidoglycan/LPS O-acetylase OafA/YrhL